ncbi:MULTISPECIES: phosphate signaling complex protein PhoU [Bacillus]|uniref:Phosphate-specific transport system accessory protein PhoU n=2 Tax=Bacillus TaxID=1386 RepID=A0A0M5JIS4_9BACI|nr:MULTISPECIES: phosphate signaling complex protein PhoU [Bacillus]ALC81631.1 PhoU family transcriptional regulator [Bacillus gobiensis]MBP1080676.1 phosphate transport system protein [Bacillus capparidis]MED1094532.1 phosphate signaling complex protein PhoU [Bacillus capparidis]
MQVRKSFDEELQSLKKELLRMTEFAQEMLDLSVMALKNQDIELAEKVVKKDQFLNEQETDLNNHAVTLIAKQAPVASDLRQLIAAIKISSEVERIGDLAVNIAKSTIRIGNKETLIKPIVDIPKMIDIVKSMLTDAILSYRNNNTIQARNVAEADDKVDAYHKKLIDELMKLMTVHPQYTSQILQLSFICRYVERIGDHITNISEHVIFVDTGIQYDLNN